MGKKLYQLPVCEHYVNTVKQLQKIVDLQTKSHRDFDVIIDFEDGLGTEDKIIQSKVPCKEDPNVFKEEMEKTFKNLQVDYLDLFALRISEDS